MAHNLCPEYFPWEVAEPTEPPEDHRKDPWRPPHKPSKKGAKTTQVAPWERSTTEVRASLMKVVEASQKRSFDKLERQDEEDIVKLMKRMGLL
jgi:hypothetical protein